MSRRKRKMNARTRAVIAAVVTFALLVTCLSCWVVYQVARRDVDGVNEVALRIAYSPEKKELFDELVVKFNRTGSRTPSGKRITVVVSEMDPEVMIDSVLAGELDAICPDSSIWLSQLDVAWQNLQGTDSTVVGETSRFAVSPVVIAMWADIARSLGYPGQSIGWADILSTAQANPDFKWSHPSTSSASGLLATLATFYAGAGKTRGLTVEDVTAEDTLNYVAALERTVRYYGEGELAVMEQIGQRGSSYLDAFVVQEQLVVRHNQSSSNKLVAVYPAEGTMWQDHPLVLLELPDTGPEERQAFRALSEFLLSQEIQSLVLSKGYRPADLSVPLDSAGSPINQANGVDPAQPKTTLQIPGPAVIEVVRDVWQYTKRKANVYLIADVSGSMQGEKLEQAQEALLAFLELIKGDEERVALIVFSSGVDETVQLAEMSKNRSILSAEVQGLQAGGDTALLDAVDVAYSRLQSFGDAERINAIVVMTDGKENNSRIRLRALATKIEESNKTGVPVAVFCVAYGGDADMGTLEALSDAAGGQTRRGSPETIRQLYRLLSQYF